MASPESSLRRRGRGSVSETSGHAKAESDGFGSFVDASSAFPSDFDQHLSEPLDGQAASSSFSVGSPTRTRADSSAGPLQRVDDEDAEKWTEADMVAGFSPAEYHFTSSDATPAAATAAQAASPTSNAPSKTGRPAAGRKISGTGASSEWADWSSFLAAHTLPTQQKQQSAAGPSSSSQAPTAPNPADDAFFDAFEVATNPNRAPSPPIIDLRGVEKKLEQKKQQQKDAAKTANSADDDFFSRFERAPQSALGKASPLVLEPDQLESMHDARISPLPTSSKRTDSYFGLTAPKPISSNGKDPQSGQADQKRDAGSGSFSPASPSSWTGSIRKTWTTLRGIQSEIASHLPSASDFIVPEDDAEEGGMAAAIGAAESDSGGGLLIASDAPEKRTSGEDQGGVRRRDSASNRRERGTLPHAWDYSQETPFGSSHAATSSGFSAGAAAPSSGSSGTAPLRARDLFASSGSGTEASSSIGTLRRGPVHSATAPISGAPGFDTSSTRKWNTGHWTLDEKEKRSIAVNLSNRRDETETVIEEFHASRLQALLPPRLQLGKRWSLLYSLDQHGISLQTLYHRVSAGLDPTKVKRSVSDSHTGNGIGDDENAAEGWLRGASRATQEAMGTRAGKNGRMHIGGGLSSISDAGLILAVKDENDNVFGAFINEKLRPQQHYYGSGECFLWKTTAGKEVERYKWTGKNDYMVLSESTFLSVGGGEGKFGLWVDGALEKGVSACCPAFDNEILCDGKGRREGEGRFECYGLEVWAVGID